MNVKEQIAQMKRDRAKYKPSLHPVRSEPLFYGW